MKKIIYGLFIMMITIFVTSCEKESKDDGRYVPGVGDGYVSMKFFIDNSTKGETKVSIDELLKNSTLKIFNKATGGMLRMYEPATDAPEKLFLEAGNYSATLSIGKKATVSIENMDFYGYKDFTIVSKQSTTIDLTCRIVNSVVKIEFDPSVAIAFGTDFSAIVAVMDEYNQEAITVNNSLVFTENGVGYFILSDEIKNISYKFEGTGIVGNIVKIGNIIEPKSANLYTLKFNYAKDPGGDFDIEVGLIEQGEIIDDDFIFGLQPSVTGVEFDVDAVVPFFNKNIVYNISGIDPLKTVSFTVGETVYTPLMDNVVVDLMAEGIVYIKKDIFNGSLTLSEAFFNKLNSGINDLTISAIDVNSEEGKVVSKVAIPGLISNPMTNLWRNTAVLEAVVTDPAITNVVFKYKNTGSQEWSETEGVLGANFIFTGIAKPNWVDSKNASNLTIYNAQANTGIFADNSYDYTAVIGVVETATKSFTTSTTQVIHDGNMENAGLSCFGENNSSAVFWASGNNGTVNGLCSSSTFAGSQGERVARLQTKLAPFVKFLASGSIHTGTFSQSGTNGAASFGQSFTWDARPKSLKLKYHARIGIVDKSKHGGAPIGIGAQDIGRIFFAIVDWDSRHPVTSGTSAPTGVWNPATITSTGEGAIIAYGLQDISTTEGDSMIELEIPISYYNTDIKPSKKYSIVISAASNAYGDYMVGCSTNLLYVDDFRFGY